MDLCMNHPVSFHALGQWLSAYLTVTALAEVNFKEKILCLRQCLAMHTNYKLKPLYNIIIIFDTVVGQEINIKHQKIINSTATA